MPYSDTNNEQNNSKRRRILLVLLLLLLVGITSCILGYILGQRAGIQQGGEIVDTIVITPGDKTEEKDPISVSGVVHYSDGTPFTQGYVTVPGTEYKVRTDENGYFFIHLLTPGKHKIAVTDLEGTELAYCIVDLDTEGSTATVKLLFEGEGNYVVEIPVNTLLVELDVTLEESTGEKENYLIIKNPLAVTREGVVYKENEVFFPERNKPFVTEINETVIKEGTVVLPNNDVLLNDNTLIKRDGTVINNEGEKEKPTGPVEFDNNTTFDPETMTVITENGTKIEIDKTEDNITPPADDDDELPSTDVNEPDDDTSKPGDDSSKPSDDTSAPEVVVPGTPDDDDDEYYEGEVEVSSENYMKWTKDTIINLFAGIEKLYPGVEGEYQFQIANKRLADVKFTVTVKDNEENAVPFEIELFDEEGNPVGTEDITLKRAQTKKYTLRWKWPFESGNDTLDTAIGTAENLLHTVTVTIYAEEIE